MSFRRERGTALQWQRWLDEHRQELLDCGLPAEVFQDRRSWFYFPEHGYFTPLDSAKPIINVDKMEKPAAERLYQFLEARELYPDSDLLNRLKHLLGK